MTTRVKVLVPSAYFRYLHSRLALTRVYICALCLTLQIIINIRNVVCFVKNDNPFLVGIKIIYVQAKQNYFSRLVSRSVCDLLVVLFATC